MPEASVSALIAHLRKMHGHLSAKDRATVVMTIDALTDLSVQLYEAKRPAPSDPWLELRKMAGPATGAQDYWDGFTTRSKGADQ